MIGDKNKLIEKLVEAIEDNDLINHENYTEARKMVIAVLTDELRDYSIVPSGSILE